MNGKFKLKLLFSILCFLIFFLPWISEPQDKTSWLMLIPDEVKKEILWFADHEEGNLSDWEMGGGENSGGGIFNTGSKEEAIAEASHEKAFSGKFSVKTSIRNAYRARNGSKAVRLMRWTDKPWDTGGKIFPDEAFYSAWILIPENYDPKKEAPWDPGDRGWWNVFQLKSDDKKGESQPVWVINIANSNSGMFFYAYSDYNKRKSNLFEKHQIPVNQWFHFEAFVKKSDPMKENGELKIWLDGKEVLSLQNVVTCITKGSLIWGIGNYTDHIEGGKTPGTAVIFFDDCAISKKPLHPFAKEKQENFTLNN